MQGGYASEGKMFSFFKKRQETLLKRIETIQQQRVKQLDREVCAKFARGNISLQNGNYFTPEDIDRLQQELVDYFLPSRSR
jgi:hypothetical protein